MGSELKYVLQSLCCSHGWSYAVFWRYDQRNSMLLTLEDAYHDEQSRKVVDDMLLQVHIFGEGIIGEAALTGNHRWMFSDTAPDSFQVEHDLQTILVVPIGSRGVVQLGSVHKILESPEILEQTTRALEQTSPPDDISGTFPSPSDPEMLDLDALFASLVPLGNSDIPESLQGLSFDEIFTPDSSSLPSPEPSSFISEICEISETVPDTDNSCEDVWEDDFGFDVLNSYSLDDLYELLAESPDQNAALNSGSVSPGAFLQEKPLQNCSDDHQEASVVIQRSENDLFDLLGLNFKDSFSSGVSKNRSEFGRAPLASPPKGLFSELGITELISSSCSHPSISVTNQTHPRDFCLSPTKRRKLETSTAQSSSFFAQSCNRMSQTMMQSLETSLCNPLSKSETFAKSQSGLWIDDRYSCNFGGNSNPGPSKKPEEGVKKKRGKPGESRRPRPKDRQMIQDRIKELRGMIPNGAKCSIDALLDLTIKHMLFMQSIAKYADKLKQPYEPKLINENGSAVEEKPVGDRNGATWAFEVGDESVVCPIIVEDLNPPGQMQIEMLCEERGQFLEIADVIKGLGLNILKGVMEKRDGKIWAHFIVEAKRHVTRLQVFWSLVQILQQQNNTTSVTLTNPMIDPSESSESISLPLSFVESLQ